METVKLSNSERLITLTKEAYEALENENRELKEEINKRTIVIRYGIRFSPTRYNGRYETVLIANEIKKFNPGEEGMIISTVNFLLNDIKEINDECYKEMDRLTKELNQKIAAVKVIEENNKKEEQRLKNLSSRIPRFFKWWLR